ncbi:PhoH family protein, partial [Corallococcus sp. AB049A]
MPLPTMPTQPAQLLDPAEFKPFGKAGKPKAGQEPRKPVPALEREALSETGRAQPKRNAATPARARSGEASPMAKEGTREHAGILAKAVDKV